MCSIISSSHCSLPCPNGGSGRGPVFEAWLNERRVFSLLYSDCFPSVVPHWPQCRCCRRRLRWECHKWPETNVGLPHLADLQHSLKTSSFFFFLSFFFLLLFNRLSGEPAAEERRGESDKSRAGGEGRETKFFPWKFASFHFLGGVTVSCSSMEWEKRDGERLQCSTIPSFHPT